MNKKDYKKWSNPSIESKSKKALRAAITKGRYKTLLQNLNTGTKTKYFYDIKTGKTIPMKVTEERLQEISSEVMKRYKGRANISKNEMEKSAQGDKKTIRKLHQSRKYKNKEKGLERADKGIERNKELNAKGIETEDPKRYKHLRPWDKDDWAEYRKNTNKYLTTGGFKGNYEKRQLKKGMNNALATTGVKQHNDEKKSKEPEKNTTTKSTTKKKSSFWKNILKNI